MGGRENPEQNTTTEEDEEKGTSDVALTTNARYKRQCNVFIEREKETKPEQSSVRDMRQLNIFCQKYANSLKSPKERTTDRQTWRLNPRDT